MCYNKRVGREPDPNRKVQMEKLPYAEDLTDEIVAEILAAAAVESAAKEAAFEAAIAAVVASYAPTE